MKCRTTKYVRRKCHPSRRCCHTLRGGCIASLVRALRLVLVATDTARLGRLSWHAARPRAVLTARAGRYHPPLAHVAYNDISHSD
jgi:hypothetical protein